MKKILILGASILQLPAILRAKELGYYVGTIDFDSKAIGIPYSDEYFNISTIDIEGVTRIAEKFHPNGIITLATDMPMRSVAHACSMLGLPGISEETAKKATNKGEMIKAFKAHKVESPWFYIAKNKVGFESIKKYILFPCIIKPTDNSGSKGVILVHEKEELDDSFAYSSTQTRSGDVIIEEYLQGPEVSLEVIVIKKNIHILAVTDKITTGAPHFVELGHCQQSQLEKNAIEKIKDLARRAIMAVGIDNGAAHVEIILTKDGPKMVELGARLGGDCITTHLVPLSTGIDMVEAIINLSCGESINVIPKFNKGSAIRYFQTKQGILQGISGVDKAQSIPGVKEIYFTKNIGDKITEIKNSNDRVGYVISQADTAPEAVAICEKAMNCIKFDIQ